MAAGLSTTLCVGFTWILALGLAGISLIINSASAQTIWTDDASGLGRMLWPAAAACMDVLKFVVMAAMASRWRRGTKWMPGLKSMLVLLSGLSIAATLTYNLELQSRSAGKVAAAQTRLADLRADHERVQAELEKYAEYPVAALVRRRMEAMEQNPRWTSSSACENATVAASRRFCAAYKEEFSRLAGATRADELRAKIAKLNHQIRQATTADALTLHRAGFAIIADWMTVDVERVSLVASVVLAVALELAGLTAWALVPSASIRPSDPRTGGGVQSRQDRADVSGVVETARPAITRHDTKKSAEPERVRPSATAPATNVTPLRRQAPKEGGPPRPKLTRQSISPVAPTDGNAALALTSVLDPSPEAFVAQCLTAASGARLQAQVLQSAYADWCKAHGLQPISQAKLAQGLTALGILKTRGAKNGGRVYHDVTLR